MSDLIPVIPVQYSTFPDDYVNDVRGWAFDETTINETAGALLTLDIDYGAECSLNCPFCFRRNNSVDDMRHVLGREDLIKIVRDAKKLGLRSIKFLGAGLPLENPYILEFLETLAALDIVPVLFSKTGVFGDDREVARLFGYRGVRTGEQLASELFQYGVSVILGFNSFDKLIQQRMVGDANNHFAKRNKSLEILVDAGFNRPNPTRLAIGVNPITIWNIDEALSVYKWARLRINLSTKHWTIV